jgi:hypothetical protein
MWCYWSTNNKIWSSNSNSFRTIGSQTLRNFAKTVPCANLSNTVIPGRFKIKFIILKRMPLAQCQHKVNLNYFVHKYWHFGPTSMRESTSCYTLCKLSQWTPSKHVRWKSNSACWVTRGFTGNLTPHQSAFRKNFVSTAGIDCIIIFLCDELKSVRNEKKKKADRVTNRKENNCSRELTSFLRPAYCSL